MSTQQQQDNKRETLKSYWIQEALTTTSKEDEENTIQYFIQEVDNMSNKEVQEELDNIFGSSL